uniref:Uncharacterized protein n=1 Tax=Thermosporothrix sp. COM3 TaxID=2490863 RepID=A0A455SPN9_9CHLR|nr:hypothetical protein KTC_38820 [Thermosporothrix sp. COM3]
MVLEVSDRAYCTPFFPVMLVIKRAEIFILSNICSNYWEMSITFDVIFGIIDKRETILFSSLYFIFIPKRSDIET